MKIVRVINELRDGGVQLRLSRVAPSLVTAGHQVIIVCTEAEGENAPRVHDAGVRVEVIPIRKWNHWGDIRRLSHFLRQERPDVVHSHLFRQNAPATVAAWLAGVKTIFAQVHLVGTYRRRSWIWTDRVLSRFRTAMLAVSEAVAQDIREALSPFPPPRLEVLLNGVELERFVREDRDHCRRQMLQEFGWAGESVVFLNAARLKAEKNQKQLVEVFHEIHRALPTARLLIAGEGDLRKELEHEIARLELSDVCVLAGFRNDVPRLMAGSDVFVLPSRAEGFSNAILEAMASGLPVIASDVGGAREVVETGRNGAVIPPLGRQALIDACLGIARSEEVRKNMAQSNRQDIQEHTHERMIERTVALYERSLR